MVKRMVCCNRLEPRNERNACRATDVCRVNEANAFRDCLPISAELPKEASLLVSLFKTAFLCFEVGVKNADIPCRWEDNAEEHHKHTDERGDCTHERKSNGGESLLAHTEFKEGRALQ